MPTHERLRGERMPLLEMNLSLDSRRTIRQRGPVIILMAGGTTVQNEASTSHYTLAATCRSCNCRQPLSSCIVLPSFDPPPAARLAQKHDSGKDLGEPVRLDLKTNMLASAIRKRLD